VSAILVTGAAGQVGHALTGLDWPEGVTLLTPDRATLDLSSPRSVAAWFVQVEVDAIVNCAAFTGVDAAEDAVGDAFAANALGPALLADQARRAGIPLVQISTDYVFDGSATGFYPENAAVSPLGVYGASKLAGEHAVLRGAPRAVVLRTAWVLGPHRHNFLKTMLRLAAQRDEIRVVDDQHGCPTAAGDIAEAVRTVVLRMMTDPAAPGGVFHFVNAGEASWCALARAILERSAELGGPTAKVVPVTSAAYPTRARRPVNSRLATGRIEREYGISPRPWREAVGEIVTEMMMGAKRGSEAA